jgi:hypothetical protein
MLRWSQRNGASITPLEDGGEGGAAASVRIADRARKNVGNHRDALTGEL